MGVLLEPSGFGQMFAAAMTVLGVTSGVWHWFEKHPYNVYDRYSMFLVLAVVFGAALESWWGAAFSMAFAAAIYQVLKRTEHVIAIQSAFIILALLIVGAPWWAILAAILLAAGAILVNLVGGYTGVAHSVWHIAMAGDLLLLFLAPFL